MCVFIICLTYDKGNGNNGKIQESPSINKEKLSVPHGRLSYLCKNLIHVEMSV